MAKKRSKALARARHNKRRAYRTDDEDDVYRPITISKMSEEEQEAKMIQENTQEFLSKWNTSVVSWSRCRKTMLRLIKQHPKSVEIALRDHQEEMFGIQCFEIGQDESAIQKNLSMMRDTLARHLSSPTWRYKLISQMLNDYFHLIASKNAFNHFCGVWPAGRLISHISAPGTPSFLVELGAEHLWYTSSPRGFNTFFDRLVSLENWKLLSNAKSWGQELLSKVRCPTLSHVFDINPQWCDDSLRQLFDWSKMDDFAAFRFIDPSVYAVVLSNMTKRADVYLPTDLFNLILKAHGQAPLSIHIENATKMTIINHRRRNFSSTLSLSISTCFSMGGGRIYLEDDWQCRTPKELMFILPDLFQFESAETVARILLSSESCLNELFWNLLEKNLSLFRKMQRLVRLHECLFERIGRTLCPEKFVADRFPGLYEEFVENCVDEDSCVVACDSDGRNLLFMAATPEDVREILRHARLVFANGEQEEVGEKIRAFVNAIDCWGMTCVDVQRAKKMYQVVDELTMNEFWRGDLYERCAEWHAVVDSAWDESRRSKKRRKKKKGRGKKRDTIDVEWKNIDKQMTKHRRLNVRQKCFGYAF